MKLLPEQVVKRPLLTEKNTARAERRSVYTFLVAPRATKTEIKHAVETLFKVTVLGVRTLIHKGCERRVGFRRTLDPNEKKAIVALKPGDKIDVF